MHVCKLYTGPRNIGAEHLASLTHNDFSVRAADYSDAVETSEPEVFIALSYPYRNIAEWCALKNVPKDMHGICSAEFSRKN